MLEIVHERAPAKVNLHLNVVSKLPSGYHALESIFQTIPLFDDLTVRVRGEDNICIVDCDAMRLPDENTLTKTYKAFCQLANIEKGIHVELKKRIPSGAGLGGGSSDAASFLKALNRMFDFPLKENQLKEIANLVGSDVTFFLSGGAALVTGRGEKVKPIQARNDLCFVMVYPGVHSSTSEAYALVDEFMQSGKAVVELSLKDIEQMYYKPPQFWRFINTFTKPVAAKYPVILTVIKSLEISGADFVQMSGSGSTVFGVFSDSRKAEKAYQKLSETWERCYYLPL